MYVGPGFGLYVRALFLEFIFVPVSWYGCAVYFLTNRAKNLSHTMESY